jgi:hypothetical protein
MALPQDEIENIKAWLTIVERKIAKSIAVPLADPEHE